MTEYFEHSESYSRRVVYSMVSSINHYDEFVRNGVSSEDARAVLPTNIMTSLFVNISMRTLQGIYIQRMCCQAQQGEWQVVLPQMKKLIRDTDGEIVSSMLTAPYERGESCGYRASFDRPCIWEKKHNDK
jgi:thymidylate synthase ThyX